MFGSRPEKNDPEIDKLNSWFTLIGPFTVSSVTLKLSAGNANYFAKFCIID